jgi:ABC-type uncharacterized transport system substrate-binding protein
MKLRVSALVVAVGLLLFVCPLMALSHPHLFLENCLTVVFDQEGLAGIQVRWVFDEFFSSMIAGDYDRNRNNRLEGSEIGMIEKEAFANLINFDYFTFIKIEGRPFKVKYIRDFSAALAGGKLIYEFVIPCHVKASSTFKELIISQYDPTYYTLVVFAKDQPVKVQNVSNFEINYRIAKNLEEAYYYGQIHPVEVILRFKRKNG